MRNLSLIALVAALATGCMSTTNKGDALTDNSGGGSGSGSGSSGSGSSGSGSTSSGTTGAPVANNFGVIFGFDPANSQVRGFSADENNPGTTFMVEFWLNQPRPNGIALDTVLANNFYFLPPNNNWFRYTLPMQYQDGVMRRIYAYQVNGAARNPLGNSPMAFWAGVNLTGKAYFDNTVRASMNSNCLSCHGMPTNTGAEYDYAKAYLSGPDKFSGGTATNNGLINRAMGIGHGGGNRCGNINQGLCALLQTWWNNEFN